MDAMLSNEIKCIYMYDRDSSTCVEIWHVLYFRNSLIQMTQAEMAVETNIISVLA